MAISRLRQRREVNIWPLFVDALASILMVVVFLVMVFVLAQFFLGEALSGRDKALAQLQNEVASLGEILSLERISNEKLGLEVEELTSELAESVEKGRNLEAQIAESMAKGKNLEALLAESEQRILTITGDLAVVQKDLVQKEALSKKLLADQEESGRLSAALQEALDEAKKKIEIDKETISLKLSQVSSLNSQVAALTALRDDLLKKIDKLDADAHERDREIGREKRLSKEAQTQVSLLNQQVLALRTQIARLNNALEVSETRVTLQKIKIEDLGKRLNTALASKVRELSLYRSEFLQRLHAILGGQPGIKMVGDRFILQSEVLFASGSAELGDTGRKKLARITDTLLNVTSKIPKEINWILQVAGHTDKRPIISNKFESNWELSTKRALSVVSFLISRGMPAQRLSATGYGEHHPLDRGRTAEAYQRNRRIELKLTQR